jgi:hypothetical protein
MVSEFVGFAKSVCSKFAPLSRDMPLPRIPSSNTAALLATGGRLKMISVAVPEFMIGSSPV